MKNLLPLISLLVASAFSAQAQTTTNVAYRITVETVTGSVTNSVNTAWRFDAGGTAKDQARLAGLQFAYAVYQAALPTNSVALAFGPWLKQTHTAIIDDYAGQKQRADNAATLAKLTSLLTANADLLSNADLTSLSAIAAKAP